MKIRISTEALTGNKSDLLWTGALYGIKYLQQLGHHIFFVADKLSPSQQRLLNNEQIEQSTSTSDELDLQIIAESEQLKAINKKGAEVESSDNWIELSKKICFPTRKATVERKTAETDIVISLNLDGTGESAISTGLGFFDHMLEQISKHGLIDLDIRCEGDLEVDEHHTIEDVAITLGQAVTKALDNKVGIQRYGFALPMDETIAEVAVDLSGRPYLVFEGAFRRNEVGDFPTEMVEHFFYSLAINLEATLHIAVKGDNDHHKIEACFKGFARCLRMAISRTERNANVLPSTKDLL